MSTTTTSPSKNSLSKFSRLLGVNTQAYGLIIALIMIWVFFFIMTDGILSLTAKFFQSFPADDDHRNTLGRHGAGHSGHPHRPVGGQAGGVCIRRGGLFSGNYH